MVRYARTAMTSAQNAGRIGVMERAKDMGINVQKKWLATLDMRTRDSHAKLDGQIRDVDEPFDSELGKIMFPGDPAAHPADVYNCRCTLVYVYPEYTQGRVTRRDNTDSSIVGNMTYMEWLQMKNGGAAHVPQPVPVKQPESEKKPAKTRIDEMKQTISEHQGEWTLEDLQDVGKKFAAEVEERKEKYMETVKAQIDAYNEEVKKLKARHKELDNEADALLKKMQNHEFSNEERAAIFAEVTKRWKEQGKINGEIIEIQRKIARESDPRGAVFKDVLKELRTCGGITSENVDQYADFTKYKTNKKATREAAINAFNVYPTAWLDKSAEHPTTLKPHWTNGRAYYSPYDGEIRFRDSQSTCVHEMGHRFERVVPGIIKSEREFYAKRTAGEELKWLGDPYDRTEVARRDQFIDPYMGKWYGGTAFELVSMGFQYAFTDYEKLSRDPDMQTWIFGILAAIP